MKHKISAIFFLLIGIFSLAATTSSVHDPVHIFNESVIKNVEQRNTQYQKTKQKPRILLRSSKGQNIVQLKPKANEVIIAVGHGKRNNVQIFAGKNFSKILTSSKCGNIVRYAGDDLRSSNNKKFNKGINTCINAIGTLIAQQYELAGNKNDLTQQQLQKIDHPQSVNMVWGIGIAIVATAAFTWYQNFKIKH
ncbi:TPM domain-containing protein [Lactobacillus sp.]|uniref:TPM domain-containing protein n=1 Tax=Lactobacillus sp. TaxID=1591 RepID=UPI0019AAB212|nr:TPM domain-containing protein [Lactobacillus sp.]MBD5429879.1 TPM domain-containing protein [Lactobacillus sp.]